MRLVSAALVVPAFFQTCLPNPPDPEPPIPGPEAQPVPAEIPGLAPVTAVPPIDHYDEATAHATPAARADRVEAFVAAGPDMRAAMVNPEARIFGVPTWGLGATLYVSDRQGSVVIGHDGRNAPSINTAARLDVKSGAGIVVLESEEHAKARGAKIYCELVGSAMNSDAYHMTSPSPVATSGLLVYR